MTPPIPLSPPPEALAHLRRDRAFAALMKRVGPLTITPPTVDPFNALARSIVFQQLSGKAASTIHGRFLDLFRGRKATPRALLKLAEDDLRAAGLSRQKLASLRDLALHVHEKRLTLDGIHELEDEIVIGQLVAVRGIGRWSAEMFLLFHLGRHDVWPVTDLGIRKGVQNVLGLDELPDKRVMATFGERFAPYRSYASVYLWRSLDGADE